jgi:hypothetical protein
MNDQECHNTRIEHYNENQGSGCGRGHVRNSNRTQCQLCEKYEHDAPRWWYRHVLFMRDK